MDANDWTEESLCEAFQRLADDDLARLALTFTDSAVAKVSPMFSMWMCIEIHNEVLMRKADEFREPQLPGTHSWPPMEVANTLTAISGLRAAIDNPLLQEFTDRLLNVVTIQINAIIKRSVVNPAWN